MSGAGLKAYFDEEDDQGIALRVYPRDDGNASVQVEDVAGAGRVLASFVADPLTAPNLCWAICAAAGQQPPVMLGRPEADPGEPAVVGQLQVWKEPDGRVGFMPADPEDAKVTGALRLAPHAVRQLAAVAVAYADAAAAEEPDPADVEDLAHAIRLELYPVSDRIGLRPGESDRAAAIAALRWMRERGAGHGQ